MIDARSYQTLSVNTDHRLVITKLRMKTDWERGRRSKPVHRGEDPVMKKLRAKRAIKKEKISNTKDDEKRQILRKERNRICNAVKRRLAFLTVKKMLNEAEEIMKAKNNAQASLALKKVISSQHQKKRTHEKEADITELTSFFQKHFTDNEAEDLNKRPVSFYQLTSIAEVASAIKKLSNHKAPGPDETTGEDLKK